MPKGWVDNFLVLVGGAGVELAVARRANGWPETLSAPTGHYFSKSVTYRGDRSEYFIGVDPKKLGEHGAGVVLCGGDGSRLRDVFVIPWKEFFGAVAAGRPVNTYRDREYYQYKLHLRLRDHRWLLNVQGADGPLLDVTHWRFDPPGALTRLTVG